MTESSDALGLGFSHSATERFSNTAIRIDAPRSAILFFSEGATQPLARSSMPGLSGAASMADREAQGGVQEAVQRVEAKHFPLRASHLEVETINGFPSGSLCGPRRASNLGRTVCRESLDR